jgi:hypothetical protein
MTLQPKEWDHNEFYKQDWPQCWKNWKKKWKGQGIHLCILNCKLVYGFWEYLVDYIIHA